MIHGQSTNHARLTASINFLRLCLLLLYLTCGCTLAVAQDTSNIELVSVNSTGAAAGNANSNRPTTTPDGRYVVFDSSASNLVPNDTNDNQDIFVRDLQTGATTLVSVDSAGTASGNGFSSNASITLSGRYVIFTSTASNLVTNDTNGKQDVFVRNLVEQKTILVSVNNAGTASGNEESFGGVITPDGRYVAFTSRANDLVAGDDNQLFTDVFRRDLQTGATVLLSINLAGTTSRNGGSTALAISANRRYVLFQSSTNDLVAGDTNNAPDLFRRDTETNTTTLVSVKLDGSGSGNSGTVSGGVMNDDGQVVAFASAASDLTSDDDGTAPDIFARDLTANTTIRVSAGATAATLGPVYAPRISSDGRYVSFLRSDTSRPPFGGLNHDKVFRFDRLTNTLIMLPIVSGQLCFVSPNCIDMITSMSASPDGRYIAYTKRERPRNNVTPIAQLLVLHDVAGSTFKIMSDYAGADPFASGGNTSIYNLAVGNVVAGPKVSFQSGVSHSNKDTNTVDDVYLYTPPPQVGKIRFRLASYSVDERGGTASVEVRRTGFFGDSTASVNYATSDGTATAATDYTAVSGTLTFGPGESSKFINIPVASDNTPEDDETVNLTLSNPTGGDTLDTPSTATLTIINHDYAFRFAASDYGVLESAGSIQIGVTLVGNPPGPVSVNYATSDGTASSRSDYTATLGRIDFAPGETSKSFTILVNDDAFVEGEETVNLTLSNPTNETILVAPSTVQLRIASDDAQPPTTNPLNQSRFFVEQHYRDFFNRVPDEAGLNFWVNQLDSLIAACDSRPAGDERNKCVLGARAQVSTAFFLSVEFQQTGYFVIRLYQISFGQLPSRPSLLEFLRDAQEIQRGVVVGAPGWEEQLEANRQKFIADWMNRSDFQTRYGATSNLDYVYTLFANAGVASNQETELRAQLVNDLDTGRDTRAGVLRRIANSRSVYNNVYNPALVLMQYYGYLRRVPNDAPDSNFDGYNFWLNKLNQFSFVDEDVRNADTALSRIKRAQVVESFIASGEYRQRFGP